MRCKECGKVCRNELCPDCRYRNGGPINESEVVRDRTLVQVFASRSDTLFRAAFTSEQLQQVSPSER